MLLAGHEAGRAFVGRQLSRALGGHQLDPLGCALVGHQLNPLGPFKVVLELFFDL